MNTLAVKAPTISIYDESLEEFIKKAMNKLSVRKENQLCLYIPYSDSRLHHFTYQQLKKSDPEKIKSLLQEHILEKKPKKVKINYKPRAKQTDTDQNSPSTQTTEKPLETSKSQITQLEEMLQKFINALDSRTIHGNPEPLHAKAGDRYLRTLQNQLIKAIRQKRVDHELWDAYIELVETQA